VNTNITTAKLIQSYAELASGVVRMISDAKREIHLASRYYEPLIGSKLIAKFGEGLNINVLDGNSSGTSFEERIREASKFDTERRSLLRELLDSPKVTLRSCRLDYSFIVVDGQRCGFEVLNPLNPHDFNFAIEISDTEIAKNLIGIFHDLSSHGQRMGEKGLEAKASSNELVA
jgi:hypothetical protein